MRGLFIFLFSLLLTQAYTSDYQLSGNSLITQNNFSDARKAFIQAFKYQILSIKGWQQTGNKAAVAQSYLNLSDLSISLHNDVLAEQYLKNTIAISKAIDVKDYVVLAYESLSGLESKSQNYK